MNARVPFPQAIAGLALGLSLLAPRPAFAGKAQLVLTPGPSTLNIGQSVSYQATLTGAKKDVVLWSVCDGRHKKCVANGSTALGRIFETGGGSGGVHTAQYSAPGTTPEPPLCTAAPGGCRISIRAQAKGAPKSYADLVIGDFLRVASSGLPGGYSAEPYNASVQAAGGTPPYLWSLTGLPPGLGFDAATGAITGTIPALPATGSYPIGVQVSDSTVPPQSAMVTFELDVAPLLDPSLVIDTPHDGVVGAQYSLAAQLSGGRAPLLAAISGGALPPGLSLNLTALPTVGVAGVPTAAGDYLLTLDLSDSSTPPRTATAQISVSIHDPLQITTASFPAGLRDEPYSTSVQASGGQPPYTFSLNTALPLGITLDAATGLVTGTPLRVYNGSVYVGLLDSGQPPQVTSASIPLSITGPLKFVSTNPAAGVFGQSYAATLQLDGGKPPFSVALAGGALPGGVDILPSAPSVVFGGVPVEYGTFDFAVQVTDSAVQTEVIYQPLSLVIRSASLGVANASLPAGAVGVPYSTFLSAIAGVPPLQWSVNSGNLPSGLTLDPATGEISGTPTSPSPGNFSIYLTDAMPPAFAQRSLSLKVNAVPPGRNDSIATATPIVAGGYQGLSLSGPGDTADTDYYELTADGGAIVTIVASAAALTVPYRTDTVIEILHDDGSRFTTCQSSDQGDPTPYAFDDPCLNDDIQDGYLSDSQLVLEVPGTDVVTFYLHVLDFNGGSRPDLMYDLSISGAH